MRFSGKMLHNGSQGCALPRCGFAPHTQEAYATVSNSPLDYLASYNTIVRSPVEWAGCSDITA